MATKRKFFRRSKASLGEKSEKPRGKQVRKKTQKNIVQEGSKPSFSFKSKLKMPQFPNIYRSISDKIQVHSQKLQKVTALFAPTRILHWLMLGIGCLVGVLLVWEIFQAGSGLVRLLRVFQQRQVLSNQLELWKDIAQKYPSYRDADFKVARLAYQLGDRATEQIYLEKVLQIDPNYQPGLKLQKMSN